MLEITPVFRQPDLKASLPRRGRWRSPTSRPLHSRLPETVRPRYGLFFLRQGDSKLRGLRYRDVRGRERTALLRFQEVPGVRGGPHPE